jgi:PAS domain S-box-containing protein
MASASSPEDLKQENEELRRRLEESEAIVRAIRRHEVDAFVVQNHESDDDILVLDGVDKPYRLIIERMQQGAAIVGTDGTIVYVNRRLSDLLNMAPSSMLGTNFSRYVVDADRTALETLLRDGSKEDAELEVTMDRPGASELSALLNVTPLLDPQGILCLMVTDLTLHKRHAEERERLVQEQAARAAAEQIAEALRTADRRKDEFLAMLGHELRNPLAPMRNGLQILNLIGSREPAARQMREMMGRQLEGLVRLVDDLLDVGRVTQGKIELHPEPTDMRQIVTRALESTRTSIDDRGHHLDLQLDDKPLPIEADVVRLTQVVINLLNNAAKFTPRGGRIQIITEADSAGNCAILRVRDNGIGIEPHMLARVFELFAQADRSVERVEGGLGIGLTLARRLIEMHDGTLSAASEGTGRGSEFTLRLPLTEKRAEVEALAGQRSAESDRPASASKRILVVDDNQDAAESLTMLLRLLGHDVREAYDGQSALTVLGDFVPDLLLLDIGLPGMNGYEVARQVRSRPGLQGVRLVALSGYGSEVDRKNSVAAGFDAHFIKPIEFSSIQTLLSTL